MLTERIAADPAAVLAAWSAGPPAPADPWLGLWRAADAQITAAVEVELGDALSEPAVARGLGAWLPGDAALVVASSMPIRDIEEFMAAREDPPRVLANRGANGIDGTVSTAYGVAAAHDGPVVLLIGDVALAHDLGGLLAGRRLGLSLTIVLIDNDGGGIFSFLPVASQRDAFETHVATPHGLDFAHAAALYGAPMCRPARPRAARCRADRDRLARHHDRRGPHRARGQPRPAPAHRRAGPGRAQRSRRARGLSRSGREQRQQRLQLDLGLGQLLGRVGIAHDPGPGEQPRPRPAEQRAAQGHAELAVAGGVDPAQRGGVQSPGQSPPAPG